MPEYQGLPFVTFYISIKFLFLGYSALLEDILYILLLGRAEEAFAFADAVIRSLAESLYQKEHGTLPLLVRQIFQDIHATFGIVYFLA